MQDGTKRLKANKMLHKTKARRYQEGFYTFLRELNTSFRLCSRSSSVRLFYE